MTARRLAAVILVLLAFFAVQGGEYSTWDWFTLRGERQEEQARIEALQRVVDSLAKEARAVETDPRVQERIARERYGMLKPGEFGYQIIRDDEP